MHLHLMRPDQIKEAVRDNVPVILAAGVIEYHGPHLPIGTDFIVPAGIAERLPARTRCIIAPPIAYGTTTNWAGPAEDGNMDINGDVAYQYAKEIMRHLVKMGFRRIYIMQYHQGMGEQIMGLHLAARAVIDEITSAWPAGWGRGSHADTPIPNIYSVIQVLSIAARETYRDANGKPVGIGHASKGETELVMGVEPDFVDMSRVHDINYPTPEWLKDSHLADPAVGEDWIEFCVNAWVRELERK